MTDREKAMLEKLKAKEQAEKKEQAKLQRQFKDLCKKNFGKTPTEINDIINGKQTDENDDTKLANFYQKVTTFYDLRNEDDIKEWLDIMLNDRSKNFWNSHRPSTTN